MLVINSNCLSESLVISWLLLIALNTKSQLIIYNYKPSFVYILYRFFQWKICLLIAYKIGGLII